MKSRGNSSHQENANTSPNKRGTGKIEIEAFLQRASRAKLVVKLHRTRALQDAES